VLPPFFASLWGWQVRDYVAPAALILPFLLQPMLLLLAGLTSRVYLAATAANFALAMTLLVISPTAFLPCAAAVLALALASTLGLNTAQRLQHNQLRMWNMRQRVAEDAEKMAARNLKMRKLAFEDPLTGLSNRLDLINKLRQILKNPREEAMHSVIYLIDLDFFKTVNDEYGHAAGDALLIEIGQRFKNIVRRGDLVCRLGGDEFVILLRGLSSHHEIVKIADKILAQLATPIYYQEQQLPLGGSIGIAPWQPDLRSPASWLALADQMMYQAKTAGRNRYVLAPDDQADVTTPLAKAHD
jgi:diguanylate cyclase (GGDEF)-like protein